MYISNEIIVKEDSIESEAWTLNLECLTGLEIVVNV